MNLDGMAWAGAGFDQTRVVWGDIFCSVCHLSSWFHIVFLLWLIIELMPNFPFIFPPLDRQVPRRGAQSSPKLDRRRLRVQSTLERPILDGLSQKLKGNLLRGWTNGISNGINQLDCQGPHLRLPKSPKFERRRLRVQSTLERPILNGLSQKLKGNLLRGWTNGISNGINQLDCQGPHLRLPKSPKFERRRLRLQSTLVALCIFDEPLRPNQLKQHRKNEYGGAPTVAEQHPTVISRRLIAISPLTPPTATTDNSTLSAHCGPQNENLGVNIKIWFFCPEVIQYPKKTLLGSNWCAESNGNTCRCVAVTVLEKKGDLVWYSAHSAPQIINSGAK